MTSILSNNPADSDDPDACSFFKMSPDPCVILSADGHFLSVNPAWESAVGYKYKEWIGKHFIDYVHPDDVKPTPGEFAENLEGKNAFEYINRYRCNDGTYKWLEWRANASEDSKTVYVVGRDITERKRIEDELCIREERYRLLAENARDVIWTMKLDGTITYISPSVEQMRGLTVEEAMNQPLEKILTPDSQRISVDFVQRLYTAFVSGLPLPTFRGELEYYRKDGSTVWTECLTYPIPGSDGSSLTMLGVTRDITERKKFEAQLLDQTNNLKELNATKDKFFSIIAHDLRSPFNGFLGLTEIISKDLLNMETKDVQKIVAILNKSARDLYALLENLLEWSRIQQGLISFTPHTLKLHEVVSSVIESIGVSCVLKAIDVGNVVPEDICIQADEYMFVAIIRNLLSNAVKFTPRGGHVVVTALRGTDGMIELSIKDTGIGMNNLIKENIFTLTEKSRRKGTENEGSTGLGLLLAKEFIEKHNGKIWVESEDGKGSIFYLTIPGANETELNPERKQFHKGIKEYKPAKKLKVLVVDDDPTSKMILLMSLEKEGNTVLQAKTGYEAVELSLKNPDIDLILIDIQMPEMDGLTATKKIREINKSVVIIAQTALYFSGGKEKAIEAGCNEYISKPIDFKELKGLIQKQFTNN